MQSETRGGHIKVACEKTLESGEFSLNVEK